MPMTGPFKDIRDAIRAGREHQVSSALGFYFVSRYNRTRCYDVHWSPFALESDEQLIVQYVRDREGMFNPHKPIIKAKGEA